MAKVHWHLGYSNKTACGVLAYTTNVQDEYDTVGGGRVECSGHEKNVTCASCRRVMLLDTYPPPSEPYSSTDTDK